MTSLAAVRLRISTRTVMVLAALTMLASGLMVATDAKPAEAAYGAMHQPVTGTVTSKINWRCRSGADNHAGIDLAQPADTPVYAAYRGTVNFAGTMSGYGKIVIINHPQGYQTRYAHLNGFRVSAGQSVGREQRIGRTGTTGNVTGPHLHFEVRRNGNVFMRLNDAYVCGNRYIAKRRIQTGFPDLPA